MQRYGQMAQCFQMRGFIVCGEVTTLASRAPALAESARRVGVNDDGRKFTGVGIADGTDSVAKILSDLLQEQLHDRVGKGLRVERFAIEFQSDHRCCTLDEVDALPQSSCRLNQTMLFESGDKLFR